MGASDTWATVAETARAVAAGATTALAVVEAALARIEARNPILNAFAGPRSRGSCLLQPAH